MNSIMPPPELFLTSQNGELKPSIFNWLDGIDRSVFVSKISKMLKIVSKTLLIVLISIHLFL